MLIYKIAFTLFLTVVIFFVGLFTPTAILLDVPFGLGYFFAELFGFWHSGPSWIDKNPPLAIFCFLGCPLLVSTLLSFATAAIVFRLCRDWKPFRVGCALVILISFFELILCVRAEPAVYFHISYFAHHAENY